MCLCLIVFLRFRSVLRNLTHMGDYSANLLFLLMSEKRSSAGGGSKSYKTLKKIQTNYI